MSLLQAPMEWRRTDSDVKTGQKKKLSEVKLEYQILTNELLKKSGISAEDMSQGMKQLEDMIENNFFLNYQIQEEEECSSWDDGWKESCDLPSG